MPQGLSLAQFDAVLFDVDGTLVDSLDMLIPGLGDAIERYSGTRPSDDEIQSLIGMPIRAQLSRYLDHQPTEDEFRDIIAYTLSRYDTYVDREKLFIPAVQMLRQCHEQGVATALVTSKNSQELADFLARFPAADAISATVCASDVDNPKPAPDSALLAIARLGVSNDRAVFIGDSIYDLRCARSAGIANVAVGYGSAPPHVLQAEHPDLYFDTPDELLAWAEQSFSKPNAPKETNGFIDDHDHERSAGAA